MVHLESAVDHRAEVRHAGVLRGGDRGRVEARRHVDQQVAEEALGHADDVLELRDGDLVDVVRLRRAAEHVDALGDGHVVALERHGGEEPDIAGRLDDRRLRREVEEDGHVAELQVSVDDADLLVRAARQSLGEVGDERRLAALALRAEEDERLTILLAALRDEFAHGLLQLDAGERLDEAAARARADEVRRALRAPLRCHAEDVGIGVGLVEGLDEWDGILVVDIEQDEVRVEHAALAQCVLLALVAYSHREARRALDDGAELREHQAVFLDQHDTVHRECLLSLTEDAAEPG